MKYLITSALPYANGPLHFGHIAGVYLPADIYARHRRLQGHDVKHISGSDEHGVAITLNAQKENQQYQDYVNRWHQEHAELFKSYGVDFDFFGQTSSDYHAKEVLQWFELLNDKGAIGPKVENQLQCQACENYLPDRYVEGECYECGYERARGDECPNCGILVESTRLKNPVCQICESKNIETKEVTQYYLLMSKFHKEFRDWFTKKEHWRKSVTNFVESLTKEGLHDRAITRDIDWGIDVPLAEARGKKFYVWFDAPIGYVSNLKQHLEETGSSQDYLKDWWQNENVEISHFIGKDNVIFHAIIFPVMSMVSGRINLPKELPANQYLNLEGKQFSKSQGWYIDAKEAVNRFGDDSLRFYLTSLIPESTDSSFTWDGFIAKVNNELANNIGNFVNRCLKFFKKNWPAGIDKSMFEAFLDSAEGKGIQSDIEVIHGHLNEFAIKKAMDALMKLGHTANEYFSEQEPWKKIKEDPKAAEQVIANSSVFVMALGCAFAPFLPRLSSNILRHFGIDENTLKQLYQFRIESYLEFLPQKVNVVGEPQGLVKKIEESDIEGLRVT
jgi:methionyl-tRNA synthetase